ncbi:TonB-dependent receptor [Hymenobacter sp. HSC-4F20]|uniref:TonB-dependent receptor n=1 Tax=Hymenobacter sp. HSC-4F20 TaxID=2864135 RepID=UPI001C72BD3F|nr:TonB-dependent receptor [Hymenobacter sp. HSC-4F20]MBX0291093.1 TonB-dependent receptor [Hymenobacter sp. HSC-4F20]
MKNYLVSGAVLLALPVTAWAQGPVSGTVTDARTGTPLPGATILLDGTPSAATNATGAFTLPAVPAGSHELRITFLGYQPLVQRLEGQPTEQRLTPALQSGGVLTGEALVTASRANDRTATAYTNLSRQDLRKRNFGQDLPYLLDQTPSVVVNSDAGAGVGYTDIRIRGTSNTGINMTINGVPLNDAESHGSFLVNLPDLASSISSIQVQRGVGTSQNGGAAFGASLNISTLDVRPEAYAETQNTFGSFTTWRNNVQFGTGLLGGHFTVDGRLSRISSDGYVKRGASDLKSYYLAAGYQGKNTLVKFITFSGREKTYQSWNGVPEPAITGDRALLQQYIDNGELSPEDAERALREGRRYSYYTYDNQTDNYQQNHYQLHLSQALGEAWNIGAALHLTRGFGYYENYRTGRKLADYGLENVVLGDTTITRSNLIDRKWLDNYFYGGTFALNYQPREGKLQATLGGAWNQFTNDHYGEVIWAQYASNSNIRQRYYFNDALKTDYNAYARATWQVLPKLGVYADAQIRHIKYTIDGIEDDQNDVTTRARYTFFNPKAGATFSLAEGQQLYASYAVGQREPVRSDFTDRPAGDQSAKAERLQDFEGGYRLTLPATSALGLVTAVRFEANYFYMKYRNQLVATGQLNDVGTALRTNAPRSYRTGVELTGSASANDKLSLSSTLTLSHNRILDFREVTYDADYNPITAAEGRTTTISYSPSVVSAHTLEGQPLPSLRLALLYKTVSRQYLDNSTSEDRRIKPYQVLDFRARYSIHPKFVKEMELGFLVNNVLNRRYEANGYTYSYPGASGGIDTFNWYFPQATRNFLASVGVNF